MRVPIICLDRRLSQFVQTFRGCFSRPRSRYFVIVLLALMLCEAGRTLTGLLRQVVGQATLSGLSQFLTRAPGRRRRWPRLGVPASTPRWPHWSTPNIPTSVLPLPNGADVPKHPSSPGTSSGTTPPSSSGAAKRWAGWARITRPQQARRSWGIAWCKGWTWCRGGAAHWSPNSTIEGRVWGGRAAVQEEDRSDGGAYPHLQPLVGIVTHVLLDSWYACSVYLCHPLLLWPPRNQATFRYS